MFSRPIKFQRLRIFPQPICVQTSSGFSSPGRSKIGEKNVFIASTNRHMHPPTCTPATAAHQVQQVPPPDLTPQPGSPWLGPTHPTTAVSHDASHSPPWPQPTDGTRRPFHRPNRGAVPKSRHCPLPTCVFVHQVSHSVIAGQSGWCRFTIQKYVFHATRSGN